MSIRKTITGAATGFVAAAIAIGTGPELAAGAVVGAVASHYLDDDAAKKGRRQGMQEGYVGMRNELDKKLIRDQFENERR